MNRFFILVMAALLASGASAAAATTPQVVIRNDAFSPQTLTVTTGTSVAFVNRDDDAHTATAVDGSFDSKGIDTGGVWRHTFTKPGIYAYFCTLHPFMKATIVVKAAAQ